MVIGISNHLLQIEIKSCKNSTLSIYIVVGTYRAFLQMDLRIIQTFLAIAGESYFLVSGIVNPDF